MLGLSSMLIPDYLDRVKFMSGNTADLIGRPDADFARLADE